MTFLLYFTGVSALKQLVFLWQNTNIHSQSYKQPVQQRSDFTLKLVTQTKKKPPLVFTAFLDLRVQGNADKDTKLSNSGDYLYNGYYMLDSSLSTYRWIH